MGRNFSIHPPYPACFLSGALGAARVPCTHANSLARTMPRTYKAGTYGEMQLPEKPHQVSVGLYIL